jgi:lysophospholipase L1-like esterase
MIRTMFLGALALSTACSDDGGGSEESDADTDSDTDSDTDTDTDSDTDSDTDTGATIDVGAYTPPPVTILPLGDSITQWNYRYNLWTKLVDSGYAFDFVGSMADEPLLDGKPTKWPTHAGLTLDSDHEGHAGWRTNQMLNPKALADWLVDYTPDLVLIHLGTNDAFAERGNAAVMGDLTSIVELLRADNPHVHVHLAKIIPLVYPRKGGGTYDDIVQGYNLGIAELAARLHTPSSPIVLVDQYEGFDGEKDTYDLVHPNASGDEKMATKWKASIDVDAGPIAIGDVYESNETALVVDGATGILANDRALAGSVRAQLGAPPRGALTLYSDGAFEYTGDGKPDQFTYRADDGTDTSPAVTVSVCAGEGCVK